MARLAEGTLDFTMAKQHVYGLAHNVCNSKKEQDFLLNHLKGIEHMAYPSGHDLILALMSPIMDGLMYGNWPWIKNGVNIL